ncbi:MAG: hypothetical protein FWE16_03270 [Firmicutes bacterium]|nr:hypothetical protein [Bacillota bacterium]
MRELEDLKKTREDLNGAVSEIRKNAIKDLGFLCSRTGNSLLTNVNYHVIYDANSKKVCDLLVVGHDLAEKKAVFPNEHLKSDDNLYVALVCYENEKVKDVYLIESKFFAKPGLFSIFGNDKKKGVCSVNLGNRAKLEQHSFGNVIKNI